MLLLQKALYNISTSCRLSRGNLLRDEALVGRTRDMEEKETKRKAEGRKDATDTTVWVSRQCRGGLQSGGTRGGGHALWVHPPPPQRKHFAPLGLKWG